MSATIDPILPSDFQEGSALGDALLALNNDNATALSVLTRARLSHLTDQAFAAWRIGEAEALVIAFDQAADYDSPNFIWFRERGGRFVYVDRVVVAQGARGRGLARGLYLALFDQARQAGHDRIVCEINSQPPNPQSQAFHDSLGFEDVGTGALPGGKTVRYMERRLDTQGLRKI